MKKIIFLIMVFSLLSLPSWAMYHLNSDDLVQQAINDGMAASTKDEGYKDTKDVSGKFTYKVISNLFTPYVLVKNRTIDNKLQMLNYTVQDAKNEIIDKHFIEIDFSIGAKYKAFGTQPKAGFIESCKFVIAQGNKGIHPATVDSDEVPTGKFGMLSGSWLFYQVKTIWDTADLDPDKPIIVRCIIDDEFTEHKYDLGKLK